MLVVMMKNSIKKTKVVDDSDLLMSKDVEHLMYVTMTRVIGDRYHIRRLNCIVNRSSDEIVVEIHL